MIYLLLAICLVAVSAQAQWAQKGVDIDGEAAGDGSGSSISMSSDGKTLAIGAFTNDGNGIETGHVRVYHWVNSSWTQKGLDIDGEAAEDLSGDKRAVIRLVKE